jgi:predicted component of type VI protein secretion system
MVKPAAPPPPPPAVKPAASPGPLPPASRTPAEFPRLQPRLTGAGLTEPCRLTRAITRIGRDPGNELVISHDNVSSLHATIEYREGSFCLEDQRSTNGTKLNGGKRLPANRPVLLKNGDRIQFATHEFTFSVQGGTILDSSPAPSESDPGLDLSGTRIKPAGGSCPNHPAWHARELCVVCKQAFCPQCVREIDGKIICAACSEKGAAPWPA